MRGLYPIVDLDTLALRGLSAVDFARAVLTVRPPLLQLRAKQCRARDTLAVLRALRPLCTQSGTLLFANDRPDLALLAGCDGVHVGQTDLTVADVRAFAPRLRVGVSTHDPEQLRTALSWDPAYVAYGPVFPTHSKDRPDPVVGLEGLASACAVARASGCPVVAIGGITLERAPGVAELGALGAVIAGLCPEEATLDEVRSRAMDLHRALGGP
jgi:thiamine-phosphate pyrophosphorylase